MTAEFWRSLMTLTIKNISGERLKVTLLMSLETPTAMDLIKI
jgi:hypothetical protein